MDRIGTTALEDPNKRHIELKRAMANALGLKQNQLLVMSEDPIIESKRRAYHELSGLAHNLLDNDALKIEGYVLSPKFDTVMASKSAMLLAATDYALNKNKVANADRVVNELAVGVTTQDERFADHVNIFFAKQQLSTRTANGQTGTVSKEVVMQDMETFFKEQFGIELKKAMVARKIDDLQKRIG